MSDPDAMLEVALENYSQGRILSDADAPEEQEGRRVRPSDPIQSKANHTPTGAPPERNPVTTIEPLTRLHVVSPERRHESENNNGRSASILFSIYTRGHQPFATEPFASI